MRYDEFYLQPKWFSETNPVSSKPASATLTFTGAVVARETVTIGTDEIYEFVASAENVTTGCIPVVVGTDLTADNAIVGLVKAINDNSTIVTAIADSDDGKVVVNYKSNGTEGNSVAISAIGDNFSWDASASTLSGGQFGTPCPMRNIAVYADPDYYLCIKEGNKSNVKWRKVQLSDY